MERVQKIETEVGSEDSGSDTALALEVSVLVPVLDEEATIEPLAQSVAEVLESTGCTFEIVFVDDGSADATSERARQARRR